MRPVALAALCAVLELDWAPAAPRQARLPDRSGVWARQGRGVFDYVCAENNRNPVADDGRSLALDAAGKPLG